MSEKPEIIYENYIPEHLEQATKLLISSFSCRDYLGKPFPDNIYREPVTEIISYESTIDFFTEMNKQWSRNGLGLIAKDKQTKEVVGVITAEDYVDQQKEPTPELARIFLKEDISNLLSFFENIDEPIIKMNPKRNLNVLLNLFDCLCT